MNRVTFLKTTILGGITLFPAWRAVAQEPARPEPIKLDIVKEFVSVSHGKFERVKEMLENNPQLLHVSNDWGGGDYESGIEAAGHVGNKEIADYLLGKGARYNIYLACMLGHLETVRLVLTAHPMQLNSKGPHGLTMLHHAIKGGDSSKPVEEYLRSLGAKETKFDFYAKG
jgi:hypothetical protein